MDFKDLSLRNKILVISFLVLTSPLLLAAVMFFLLPVPFEYPRYKSSRYYKKHKEKYSAWITAGDSYKVINYLEKENIYYDSFDHKKEELVTGGITYLFPWFEYISFNDDGECIIAEQDNYDPILLSEDPKVKNREDIRILIHKKAFEDLDLERAASDEMLVIYDRLSDLRNILR